MKRALLAGLMLAQGWAGACSPAEPSAAFLKANKQLLAFKSSPCTAPQMPRSQTWCRVFTARPSQVIPLLATMYSAKIKRNGDDWTLNAEADRVVVQVQATNAGTRAVGQRLIPVQEKLSMELYYVLAGQPQNFWPQLKRLFAPPTCQSLGITDTA